MHTSLFPVRRTGYVIVCGVCHVVGTYERDVVWTVTSIGVFLGVFLQRVLFHMCKAV
jgi:hypothetical protein